MDLGNKEVIFSNMDLPDQLHDKSVEALAPGRLCEGVPTLSTQRGVLEEVVSSYYAYWERFKIEERN